MTEKRPPSAPESGIYDWASAGLRTVVCRSRNTPCPGTDLAHRRDMVEQHVVQQRASRWEQLAPAAGLVIAATLIAHYILDWGVVRAYSSPAPLVQAYLRYRDRMLADAYLYLIGGFFGPIYLIALWAAFRRAAGTEISLALFLISGLGGLICSAVVAASRIAVSAIVPASVIPDVSYAVFISGLSVGNFSLIFTALFLLMAAHLTFRTAALPRWLGWTAVVAGVLSVLVSLALPQPAGLAPLIGLIAAVFDLAFTIGSSIVLLLEPPSNRVTSEK